MSQIRISFDVKSLKRGAVLIPECNAQDVDAARIAAANQGKVGFRVGDTTLLQHCCLTKKAK